MGHASEFGRRTCSLGVGAMRAPSWPGQTSLTAMISRLAASRQRRLTGAQNAAEQDARAMRRASQAYLRTTTTAEPLPGRNRRATIRTPLLHASVLYLFPIPATKLSRLLVYCATYIILIIHLMLKRKQQPNRIYSEILQWTTPLFKLIFRRLIQADQVTHLI